MEGRYVTWEVAYPVDEYMETTKTTKVNGVSTGGPKKYRSSWIVIDGDRGIEGNVDYRLPGHKWKIREYRGYYEDYRD